MRDLYHFCQTHFCTIQFAHLGNLYEFISRVPIDILVEFRPPTVFLVACKDRWKEIIQYSMEQSLNETWSIFPVVLLFNQNLITQTNQSKSTFNFWEVFLYIKYIDTTFLIFQNFKVHISLNIDVVLIYFNIYAFCIEHYYKFHSHLQSSNHSLFNFILSLHLLFSFYELNFLSFSFHTHTLFIYLFLMENVIRTINCITFNHKTLQTW